jgi:HPt (histidine-containing phosphotransfer) domain-containing protein
MSSLERVVSQIAPSPSQTPSYPQYQGAQVTAPYSQPSPAQPIQYLAAQVQPTSYSNGYTTPTSSPASTEVPQISAETAAVVNHFGLEAPGILNQYATTLEDALVQQQAVLEDVTQRAAAMGYILTDGEQLADYTDRYFTEVEPLDDNEPTDQQSMERALYERMFGQQAPSAAAGYGQLPAVPANASVGSQSVDPQSQWQQFDRVMTEDPQNAWRYLNAMSPEAFRSKLLFMDSM